VGWSSSGWIVLPFPLKSVCQRHAPPSYHTELALYADDTAFISQVPQADAARQLPGVILNNLHRWLSEWGITINVLDNLRAYRTALHLAPTGNTFPGTNRMVRHNSLSEGDPRFTTHVVASHGSGQEEGCSKDGYALSAPEQGKRSFHQGWGPAI